MLTESKSKEKNLGGKGMKIPGGSIFMTPESGDSLVNIVNIVTMPIYQDMPLSKWNYNIGISVRGKFGRNI